MEGDKQQTKAIPGKLNPVFKKESSTFHFDVGSLRFNFNDLILMIQVEDPSAKRIYFEVMDKDTFTKDDLIGEVILQSNLKIDLF